MYYPLKLYVCDHCWLVQTEDYARADELFRPDYAYFSSTSSTGWPTPPVTRHDPRGLTGADSLVIEVAANDGYLLQEFRRRRHSLSGHRADGDTAAAAEALGIPILREFFGAALADLAGGGRPT